MKDVSTDSDIRGMANRLYLLMVRLRRLKFGLPFPHSIQIPPALMVLIDVIATQPGQSIIGIAKHLNLATPTVSIGVRQLERENLIYRRPDPADGRSVQIFLTAKGKKLYERLCSYRLQKFEGLFGGLTPEERKTLLDLLERAVEIAEKREE